MPPEHGIIRTVDPRNPTGPRISAVIPNDLIRRAYKYDTVQFENVRTLVQVLDDPKRIFTGLRELNAGWYCYTGKPKTWYVAEDQEVPFPADLVYIVCMNDRMWVYEWRAERADTEDPLSPVDWKNRFAGLVWTSTS